MKLQRSGRYRNHGASLLTQADLTERKFDRWTWDKESGQVHFFAEGKDRGARYNYRFEFGIEDLLSLFGAALPSLDSTSRAIAAGALASLKEILAAKAEAAGSGHLQ